MEKRAFLRTQSSQNQLSLCNPRSLRMPMIDAGRFSSRSILTVITRAGNSSYANKSRGAFLSVADIRACVYVYARATQPANARY